VQVDFPAVKAMKHQPTRKQRRGLKLPAKKRGKSKSNKADAWRDRVNGMFKVESELARSILREYGIPPNLALGFIKSVSGFGAVMVIDRTSPKELHDADNPCFFAVRLLALCQLIADADPKSLQVGRMWGRFSLGLGLPKIAKAVRDGHLAKHRGPGGGTANDLTRTLEAVLSEHPNLDSAGVIIYLRGEEAMDRFSSAGPQTIFVTGVEFKNKDVIYEDRQRNVHKIKITSLARKITKIREKAKG
jgi:hypothetical protein